jgi:hypothetical protein
MSKSYFERYRAGERLAVWQELVALGGRIQHPSLNEDALEVARETMGRVLVNVTTIASRMVEEGYTLGEFRAPPPADTEANIAQIEREAGVLPLSLRAFYEVVGAVSLLGQPSDGELYYQPSEVYPDPLETMPVDYAVYELREWKERRMADGNDETGPFEVSVSADDYHKADVSGGEAYRIVISEPSMDGKLANERHDLLFVDYLRLSFAWGGFPGFDRPEARPPMALIKKLRQGLLEI